MKRVLGGTVLVGLLVCGVSAVLVAQSMSVTSSATVPNLISYSGLLKDAAGKSLSGVVGVTFLLYKDEEGGAPLWLETQNVTADSAGHFSAQLGATSAHGLPADLFRSGEARWLAVQVAGQSEPPRILLVAVPYALKAADAETVGGLPPSAFVLAAPPNVASTTAETLPQPLSAAAATAPPPASTVTTTGGTVNTFPLFTTATNIQNSIVTQTGTTAINVAGKLNFPSNGIATATAGAKSQPEVMTASSFNSSTATAVAQNFQWQGEPAANNTSAPSGTLNLLYAAGTGVPAETGLKISSKGVFTFAKGQTFTGAGTVTSAALSAPASDFTVTGSPITKSGTFALNWAVAPTNANTANAIVKRDGNGSFNAGEIFASANDLGNGALNGTNTNVLGTGVAGAGTFGVSGSGNFTSGFGVFGEGWIGVSGSGPNAGVSGSATAGGSTGVQALGGTYGVNSTGTTYGVYSAASGTGTSYGVYATTAGTGAGVYADGGSSGEGVYANSVNSYAVEARGSSGVWSLVNQSLGTGVIAYGWTTAAYLGTQGTYAGEFSGDVSITGNLSKSSGSFKIDHPLDPANKYLYHSFVESPDMMNIYNGEVVLDAGGQAVVQLPDWFGKLNRDFRYQLTAIGAPGPNLYIAEKIKGNTFRIAGGQPGMEVSWQITGVRQDAWANAHRIPVEEAKPESERGFYLHPELYSAPEERSVMWAQHPKEMQLRKEQRSKAEAQRANRDGVKPSAQ